MQSDALGNRDEFRRQVKVSVKNQVLDRMAVLGDAGVGTEAGELIRLPES